MTVISHKYLLCGSVIKAVIRTSKSGFEAKLRAGETVFDDSFNICEPYDRKTHIFFIPADMLSRYMESVHPDAYHNELIALLMTPSSVISDTALANYVVFAADDLQIKLQNSLAFAGCNGNPSGESRCRFRYLNEEVDCSLFQAYVLAAEDSAALAGELTAAMKQAGARLSQPVMVNGQRMKFKKYVSDRKSMLSPMTLALCEENNVFSLFF